MMSISVLPGEILYIVFELVDINTWHLQLIRGHALVPVACVCKRWKSIVDKLIYVNLGIRTPNALLRLIDHLSKNGDVTDIVSRTTRRLWSSYADRHAWRSHDSTTIMDKLIALLNMLRALHIVNILFCLPARALSALLDTSGSTIQDLSLVTSSETFNEDSLSKLRNLVRLARLSISFDASSGEDVLPTDMPRIFLPSVETVRLSYPHWWGGCNVLLRAFEFRSLTSVDIKCHRKDIATHLFHAVETFLRRHSETVTELTLSPPNSINVSDLITPLTNLHRLEISSFQLDPSIPAALPSTLSDLRLSLAQTRLDTTTMKVDHQWEFFHELLGVSLPSLKSIQGLDGLSPLDWRILEAKVEGEVARKLKTIAVVLKGKGIDLFDIYGRTYIGAGGGESGQTGDLADYISTAEKTM